LELTVKLERVEIARLRGIPGDWPVLSIGEKGLIVYGPNGVGKSSIIDALEATIRGRSSLFKDNRAGGVNWDDASPHIKGGAPSCTIHGTLNGKPQALTLGSRVG
jgi:recombinational DNA repair ATPase RecF